MLFGSWVWFLFSHCLCGFLPQPKDLQLWLTHRYECKPDCFFMWLFMSSTISHYYISAGHQSMLPPQETAGSSPPGLGSPDTWTDLSLSTATQSFHLFLTQPTISIPQIQNLDNAINSSFSSVTQKSSIFTFNHFISLFYSRQLTSKLQISKPRRKTLKCSRKTCLFPEVKEKDLFLRFKCVKRCGGVLLKIGSEAAQCAEFGSLVAHSTIVGSLSFWCEVRGPRVAVH